MFFHKLQHSSLIELGWEGGLGAMCSSPPGVEDQSSLADVQKRLLPSSCLSVLVRDVKILQPDSESCSCHERSQSPASGFLASDLALGPAGLSHWLTAPDSHLLGSSVRNQPRTALPTWRILLQFFLGDQELIRMHIWAERLGWAELSISVWNFRKEDARLSLTRSVSIS